MRFTGEKYEEYTQNHFTAACGVRRLFVCFYKTPEQRAFEKTLAAAQAGNAEAALAVAGLYAHGTGVKPNGAQAAEWYRKAAADGSAEAAWKLADLYIQGTLVPQDLEEALAYIQLAARQGSARAQSELGRFYAEGLANLPVNRGEALYWWLQAAEAGDESAQTAEQDARLEEPELYEEVKRFLSVVKRAQEGDASARLEAGQGFRLGYPVARNDEEALRWFTLAWEEGEKLPQAAYELAQMYQKGEGVEKTKPGRWNFLARPHRPRTRMRSIRWAHLRTGPIRLSTKTLLRGFPTPRRAAAHRRSI